MVLVIAAFQVSILTPVADADIISGVYSDVTEGMTSAGSPLVYTSTNFASNGGQGFTSAGLNIYDSMTDGTLYGSIGTQVDSPFLRGISQPTSADGSTLGWVGAMAAYQYNGASSALITFDWNLTGNLTQPMDTGALIRGSAGFVTDAAIFDTNINNFFEGGGTVEDDFSFFQTGAGIINETGTLSFMADPGDIFNLVMGLQTYGGRSGAIADAFSTFQGNLTSSTGTITIASSAVPEPASAGLLAILASTFLLRRRRKR